MTRTIIVEGGGRLSQNIVVWWYRPLVETGKARNLDYEQSKKQRHGYRSTKTNHGLILHRARESDNKRYVWIELVLVASLCNKRVLLKKRLQMVLTTFLCMAVAKLWPNYFV